jgi:prepilin-type N-terminal cleavage/methylation domain-containing protein
MRDIRRSEGGFTLIELMVVVMIIGVLVAIAIPVFHSTERNTKLRACLANLRTMEGAIQQYNAEADNFNAPQLTDLNVLFNPVFTQGCTFGPWVGRAPVCPDAGTYTLDANGRSITCSVHGHV